MLVAEGGGIGNFHAKAQRREEVVSLYLRRFPVARSAFKIACGDKWTAGLVRGLLRAFA
jgi:hypothetical protein